MFQTENLQEKWQPVLEHPELPKIGDSYRRAVTTVILENQEKQLREDRAFLGEAAPTNSTGAALDNWDPILISLVRRSMPNLIAYDVCGVQPMTGPTGLIFAMRARAASMDGAEALADEQIPDLSNQDAAGDTGGGDISGTNPAVLNDSPAGTYSIANGMTTAQGETLGDGSDEFAEMAFSIEKHTVTAVTRALKADTQWNLLKTLKQSTVWMQKQNCQTFCLLKFLLKLTEKLSVRFTTLLLRVLKSTQLLLVSLIWIQTQTVAGQLKSSRA